MVDAGLKRNSWPKGIVTAVFPGRDGMVRVAEVKTDGGTFKRPITKLCRLDVRRDNGGVDLEFIEDPDAGRETDDMDVDLGVEPHGLNTEGENVVVVTRQ